MFGNNNKSKAIFLDVKPSVTKNSNNYEVDRRKSSVGVTTQRNSIHLYGTEHRPSLASVKSFHNFKEDIIYGNIKPAYMFLKAIGVFPISRPEPGEAYVSGFTPAFAYSMVFFLGLTAYVGYVTVQRLEIVANAEGRFEEAVIAYLFLINILPILMYPLLWIECKKVAQVMNDWVDFEILYFQVSGRVIPLNIKKKALIISIILPILSALSVIIVHVTMSEFKIVQVIPYCILDNLTVMLGAWWYLVCECVSSTAYILAEEFQKALRHVGPAGMVADYRALWLRLSKLTRDIGISICYSFTYMNLYLFFIITLSIYGLMSQISQGFGVKDLGLTTTALSSICLLFFICDEAHYASHHVRTNFQKKLLMVELSWMNSDAQTEISMFLRATEMNPSDINCGGFFDVNRNLFKSLLTTMVTYLVVLLQFQISLPSTDESNANNGTTVMNATNNNNCAVDMMN